MAQQRNQALAAYPKIFDLLKTDTIPEAKDRLETLTSLALKERLALVVVVAGQPRHIRVLWGIERLPVSFTNSSSTDGQTVTFSRDMVEGTLPPTVKINHTWWELTQQPVVSAAMAPQLLSGLSPIATEIPALTTANDRAYLPLASLAPLQFLHPLLAAPYLSPPTAYTLLTAQAAAMRWEDKMETFLTWL